MSGCFSLEDIYSVLRELDAYKQIEAFKKIQTYVLVTIFVLLLQLGHLVKPFGNKIFRVLSWVSYLLVPVLISYILGLMGRSANLLPDSLTKLLGPNFKFNESTVDTFRYLSCVWSIFLLFAYAGFDNLNAFSLEERNGRAKLLIQVGIQFSLLILIIYQIPADNKVVALSFSFLVLTFKFGGRLVALAHSAGATSRIKKDVTRIINYSNRGFDTVTADPVTMAGFDYLLGSKYTKLEAGRIVEGITIENVFGSQGRLLKEGNEELKDTGLSFALFWLLLGKYWSYPIYDDDNKSSASPSPSRIKAWRFVRHVLLAEEGVHERVFRVIEIELAFLRDYFHARYIFFYLNGFYWKLVSIVALPAMFWWFIQKAVNKEELHNLEVKGYGEFGFTSIANKMVISVIVFLEIIQLVVFLTSRWLKVNLLCFYVKSMVPANHGSLSHFFAEVVGFIFLGSSRSSNSAWWRKPWKREMSQYSLVESCTTLLKPTSYLQKPFIPIISIAGLPFLKPGRKLSKAVKVSDEVKKAVVLFLQRDETSPKLSSGAESLRRNQVTLPDWASHLKNDTETILVWHIATSVCELQPTTTTKTNGDAESTNSDMKVAIELSKYCAYLLFFEPGLLPVPSLAAGTMCDTAIEEAIGFFDKQVFGCGGKLADGDKYKKMISLCSKADRDEEGGVKWISDESVLKKGAELGRNLMDLVKEGKEMRWKILADFWTEMILYLAPSNNNELEHARKLSQGGEFITQLWTLLIHAGIHNRDEIDRAF